jgi:Lrp/AsnC family transcriptional regulator, leucine-responsive regulatory protein
LRLQGTELARDKRNAELLKRLRADPRSTVSALARHVGMSAPAVRERLQRLEEAGVIRGYRVDLDPAALGYPIAIVMRMRPMPGKLSKVVELAERLPQVVECCRITGEDCFLIRAYIEDLGLLDRLQERFAAYGQTTTSVIQSSPVPPRSLPLPGERDSGRERSTPPR